MSNKLMTQCSLSEWTTNFIIDSYQMGYIINSSDIERFITSYPLQKKIKLGKEGIHFESETFQDVLFFDLYVNSYINDWSDYLTVFQDNNPRLSEWFCSFDRYFRFGEVN